VVAIILCSRDGLLDYRWLDVNEADESCQGDLVGIDWHSNDLVRAGVGCNCTDISDDLADLDEQNSGWFINIVGKIQAVADLKGCCCRIDRSCPAWRKRRQSTINRQAGKNSQPGICTFLPDR
jgi:hypothetical protein